ncbi:hypothetical protein EJD97_023246, partial [Solanum chilense]
TLPWNMNTRGANARRAQDENVNKEVPPQVPQSPQAPNLEGAMLNVKIRVSFQSLTQLMMTQVEAMTTQDKRGVGPSMNHNEITPASRIRDFTRMNPTTFDGTKVDEDLQGLIDEVFDLVDFMRVNSRENKNKPM